MTATSPGIATSPESQYSITEDRWLSERLGKTAWTFAALPPGMMNFNAGAFHQARVHVDDVSLLDDFQAAGFRVVSTQLTVAPKERLALAPLPIRDGRPDDEAVIEIAERNLTTSRFHLDPQISNRVARQIKRDWARNCLNGRGRLLVAERKGCVAGFVSILGHSIDLIAVDPEFQGTGVGEALVRRAMHDEIRSVGTQAANLPAIRLYERLGLRLVSAAYDLHLHA